MWVVSHHLLAKVYTQDNTGRPLKHQVDDGLKTRNMDVALSLLGKDVVLYQYPASTIPIGI